MRPRSRPTRAGAWTPPRNAAYLPGHATGGGASLLVEWTDASADEDGFRIELSTDSFTSITKTVYAAADAESVTVTGLLFYQEYAVRVYAYNEAGDSAAATTSPVTTVPDVPRNVAVTTDGQTGSDVLATCSPPAGPTAGAYDYLWQYKLATEPETWTNWTGGNMASETITGLTGETAYDFRVSGRTAAGAAGSASASVSATTGEAAASGSPTTTNLIAWWDFANATDAHASYDLTEVATPTYTAGPPSYGTAVSATNEFWTQSGVTGVWGNAAGDWSVVMRVKNPGVSSTNDYLFSSNNSANVLRHNVFADGGWGKVGFRTQGMDQVYYAYYSTDWTVFVITWDDTTNTGTLYINGTAVATTTTGTPTYVNASLRIGSSSSTTGDLNGDVDYMGIFSRVLTPGEITWIVNSGATRSYSDL